MTKKTRRGRPPIGPNPIQFGITIDEADLDRLDKIAKRKNETIASLIREAIKSYLKRQKG